ncbi:MAG: sulfurtransferase complex subunit TusD [Deltaproteobacteria bacterium]|nr:sulfurtransferase complex subunit TusD [Deltaproteobacteria bacterium]MCL5879500.1 sulfurtransferase complex subunit TusD [Deltaproteobacteria bacterium]MDA8305121.1 sulfurtransferase complex subunit TusD [Deltaproteobacteria bacterium]
MKFGILIKDGPYMHQAMDTAYNFIVAAMEMGHEITGVFFYNDGVYNRSNALEPPIDERNIMKLLTDIELKGVRLIVCVAAGKRRGIVNKTVCEVNEISGLGQLLDLCIASDRMITF